MLFVAFCCSFWFLVRVSICCSLLLFHYLKNPNRQMPFVARFGFLWMFPFEHRTARCGFLLVRKTKTSNKRQKSPNGKQA